MAHFNFVGMKVKIINYRTKLPLHNAESDKIVAYDSKNDSNLWIVERIPNQTDYFSIKNVRTYKTLHNAGDNNVVAYNCDNDSNKWTFKQRDTSRYGKDNWEIVNKRTGLELHNGGNDSIVTYTHVDNSNEWSFVVEDKIKNAQFFLNVSSLDQQLQSITPQIVTDIQHQATGIPYHVNETLNYTLGSENSFESSVGISLTVGAEFSVGVEGVASAKTTFSATTSYTMTTRNTVSSSTSISAGIDYDVPADEGRRSVMSLQTATVNLPYRSQITYESGAVINETGTYKGVCYASVKSYPEKYP
jgi:hypothetical protein